MAPVRIRNILANQRPSLTMHSHLLYEKNLDYASRQYKPMIDYLNERDQNRACQSTTRKVEGINNAIDIIKSIKSNEKKFKSSREKLNEVRSDLATMGDNYLLSQDEGCSVRSALNTASRIIRAKSAKAIEGQLTYEATKNLSECTGMDVSSYRRNIQHQAVSGNFHDSRAHAHFMDVRMENLLDKSVTEPLNTLKRELKGYENRSTGYFIDKR